MSQVASVPCGKCRLCCQKEAIVLMPHEGDDIASYEHVMINVETTPMLKVGAVTLGMREQKELAILRQQPNGDCVYLDRKTGCTIHDRAPAMCKRFDCRKWFLKVMRGRFPNFDREIAEAGRKRLHTLPLHERFNNG